jgi:hypothetical protein
MRKSTKPKKPTKQEIKRIADLFVGYQDDPDQNHKFLYRLYLALNTNTHKKAAVETILSEAFNIDPF